MINYISLLTIILIVSCSSAEKDLSTADKQLEDEFYWIENSDFDPVREAKYSVSNDRFTKNYDSLSSESIARLSKPRLEGVDKSSNNPLDRAASLCYQGNFNEGFRYLDEAYKEYRNNKVYWNQLGTCYYLKGEVRKALLYYNKSRTIDPKYTPPINNIGVIHQGNGKDQKAMAAYQEAANLGAFSVTPVFNLSQLYLKYGLTSKAEKYLRNLHRRNDDDTDVLNSLALVALYKGDVKEALDFYDDINESFVYEPYIALNYAVALKMNGASDDAKKLLSRINLSNIGNLDKHYERVRNYVEK